MTGRKKCELLRNIRKTIADMNGIDYEPEKCTHTGDCPGFCPCCDQEADYLMRELRKKEAAGSPIRIDTDSISLFETLASIPVSNEGELSAGIIRSVDDLTEPSLPAGCMVAPFDIE